ncbi:putative alpha-L-rhamnosidase [Seiridium cardinale]
MALQLGLVPPEYRADITTAFIADADESGHVMRASEIGLKYLWNTLAEMGKLEGLCSHQLHWNPVLGSARFSHNSVGYTKDHSALERSTSFDSLLSAYATIVSYNNFRTARNVKRNETVLESADLNH